MTDDSQSNPFGTRAVIILITAGILLAFGYLLLSGFGEELSRGFVRQPGPLSNSATGFRALYRLIETTDGGMVSLVQDKEDYETPDLLVLTPGAEAKAQDIKAILDERTERPTLIVLPKWQTEAIPLQAKRERWVATLAPEKVLGLLQGVVDKAKLLSDAAGPGMSSEKVRPVFSSTDALSDAAFVVPRYLQVIDAPELDWLIGAKPTSGSERGAVLGQVHGKPVYILADPDLLSNHALKSSREALAALRLLAALDENAPGTVSFDMTLHYRAGDRNLIKLMFTPPFLAVTIALTAAALLAGIASAARFGPARREARAVALGKAALIDNIAALTRLAGRTREGGDNYGDAMRDWAARRLRAPRGLADEALDAWIDAHGRGTLRFSEIQVRLRAATNEHEVLRAARELDDWRKELTA